MKTLDGTGHWRLRFGITNVGDGTVITSQVGKVEVFNHTNLLGVAMTAPKNKLAPGQGHLVDVILSDAQMTSIDGKWRYIFFYAENSFRCRLYQWQWGPRGPGRFVNWLIPMKLKGMPLTVKGASDWIDGPIPLQNLEKYQ